MSHVRHSHVLSTALWLTTVFMLVELIGGFVADSLALMADAGHMASDMLALGLAMIAQRIAGRPAHAGMSYGYGRAKVLAAQVNGLMLWVLSGWISWEAIARFADPPAVHGWVVLVIATIGLVVNFIIMRWLHGSHDINIRAAYWHVIGDALGSVAAIVSGLVILWTDWMLIDPILSFIVAGILVWGGWRLIRETTHDLMEGLPRGIDSSVIAQAMQQVEGVLGVHHMHIWRLPNGQLAASAHVQVESMSHWPELFPVLRNILHQHEVVHVTLQPEMTCWDKDQCS